MRDADGQGLTLSPQSNATRPGPHDSGRFCMHAADIADLYRTSVERLLALVLPRRPRCFDSDAAWSDFLLVAHESGKRVVRRQDTGKHSGHRKVIPVLVEGVRRLPCSDCQPAFRRKMETTGRCERVSAINAARKWLKAVLLATGPMPATELRRMAKDVGFRGHTLYRAAQRVKVRRRRADPDVPESSVWSLPQS